MHSNDKEFTRADHLNSTQASQLQDAASKTAKLQTQRPLAWFNSRSVSSNKEKTQGHKLFARYSREIGDTALCNCLLRYSKQN
jgi:hypothetical protein